MNPHTRLLLEDIQIAMDRAEIPMGPRKAGRRRGQARYLAEMAEIDPNLLQRKLRGSRQLSLRDLFKLADALGCRLRFSQDSA